MATALMVIDVQQGMFSLGPQPHDGTGVVSRIRALIEDARRSGTPIFFVQHDGGEGDPLAAGSPGFPFVPELTPEPLDDVTVKREPSAFDGTNLEKKLRDAGIDRLVVCGMQTEFCVNATVRAAAQRTFDVTLVSDAHTTFDEKDLAAQENIARHNRDLGSVAAVAPANAISFD